MGSGGGRFDITADADPAAVLDAVRRGLLQVCKERLSAEFKRLRPVLAAGSGSEAAEAVRAISLVVTEAAEVVAEADAVLRRWGLADEDITEWSSRRKLLEVHIKQSRMLMASMERDHPESWWTTLLNGLVGELSLVSGFTSNWCKRRPQLPAGHRAPPAVTAAIVDDLASGVEAVQLSAQQ